MTTVALIPVVVIHVVVEMITTHALVNSSGEISLFAISSVVTGPIAASVTTTAINKGR